MLNLGGTFTSGSYYELRSRVLQRLRLAKINDHVFELIQAAYNGALAQDNLVLSPVEKRRLLAEILKLVLNDMNKRLGQV